MSLESKNTDVQEWMSKIFFTIREDSSVESAYRLMQSKNIRHLLVVGPNGKIGGVFTAHDFARHLLSPARDLTGILFQDKVGSWMSSQVHSIQLSENVKSAVQTMLKENISILPVLDEQQKPLGVLTTNDLLNLLCNLLESPANHEKLLTDMLLQLDRSSLGYLE